MHDPLPVIFVWHQSLQPRIISKFTSNINQLRIFFIADELIETLSARFATALHIGYRRNSTTNSKRNIDRSATSRTKLTNVFDVLPLLICLKHQFISQHLSIRVDFAIPLGSPASRKSTKFTPLTVRPFLYI
jgi:hypothetical protein